MPRRARRSRSPQPPGNIDRYVPGSPRRRSRSPSRRFDLHSYPPNRNLLGGPGSIDRYVPQGGLSAPPIALLPDPHKLEYLVTYTYFSEWYYQENGHRDKESVTKDEVQSAYDRYKDILNARLAKIFVMAHKGDEWFKERYLPGQRELTKAKIVNYRRGLWYKWKAQMDAGAFDEVDREAQAIKGEAGEDTIDEVNRGIDDGGLRPVLLIKTISPTVSRVQLEEVGFFPPPRAQLEMLNGRHRHHSLPPTTSPIFTSSLSPTLIPSRSFTGSASFFSSPKTQTTPLRSLPPLTRPRSSC